MPEEIYYAPLASAAPVQLDALVSLCAQRGRKAEVEVDSPEMCWVHFEGLESQLVVSTSADARKEIGLVTIEFAGEDGEDVLTELSGILESLGFSNDPDAQYR